MENRTGSVGMGAPYEYTVKSTKTKRRAAIRAGLVLVYTLWTVGNVALMLSLLEYLLLFVAFIPASLWALVHFTWRRTDVEYEYSFFGDTLTVSRILGGRARRELVTVPIRELSLILPYDDEHLSQITQFAPRKKLYAVSDLDAPTVYALLWKEDDKRLLLCIEPSEEALKRLRFQNLSAFRR